jgi:hypothetical protein
MTLNALADVVEKWWQEKGTENEPASAQDLYLALSGGLIKKAPNSANLTKLLGEIKKRLKDIEMSDIIIDVLEFLGSGASEQWSEVIKDSIELEKGKRASLKSSPTPLTEQDEEFAEVNEILLQASKHITKLLVQNNRKEKRNQRRILTMKNLGLFATRARIRDSSKNERYAKASETFNDERLESSEEDFNAVLLSFLEEFENLDESKLEVERDKIRQRRNEGVKQFTRRFKAFFRMYQLLLNVEVESQLPIWYLNRLLYADQKKLHLSSTEKK